MKLRDWLSNGKDEQAKEPVEVAGLKMDSNGEVLESGFTLKQLVNDINGREEAIDELQHDVDRHEKKKKRAVEKAQDAETQTDKKEYMVEAKEHKLAKEKKENILEHLLNQKLTLKELKLQHFQDNIGDTENTELDIDLSEIAVSDIEAAVEESADETWEETENMEDLSDAMSMADRETSSLDLSDIESEVNGNTDEVDLSQRTLETEEEIDQAIEEELEKMEDIR